MEGISIIIPVHNKLDVTKRCLSHIRDFNGDVNYEIIIADNDSHDDTEDTLSRDKTITYIRNENNLGLSSAYNRAVNSARFDTLCFMHNDVFVYEQGWIDKIRHFILGTPHTGIVGLYGAKTIREDSSFRGKTIIHAKKESPTMRKPAEKVAVVDGLLLAMSKEVFNSLGGFNEDFSIHGYDKDISLQAVQKGFKNYVLNIPFEHLCSTTRKEIKKDDEIREESRRLFLKIWGNFLPVDVSTGVEKLKYILKKSKR